MEKKIIGPYGKEWPRDYVLESVGKGWGDIVSKLIDDLFELGWDGELHQIKEKFGGLRFYIGGGSDEVHKRIGQAENESLRTCERCGRPGKPTNDGWVQTLCEAHRASKRVEDFVQDEHFKEKDELVSESGS